MEMLVVVGIMLILTGIGFSNYVFSIVKSRDVRRKSDLSTISRALQAFANDFGSYPQSDANGKIIACDYNNTGLVACTWGAALAAYKNNVKITYISILPADPESDKNYYYEASANGATFSLFAALENDKDPSYRSDLTQPCGFGVLCSYQLTESGVQ